MPHCPQLTLFFFYRGQWFEIIACCWSDTQVISGLTFEKVLWYVFDPESSAALSRDAF